MISLTPAYDICPQARTGGEATQAMFITGNDARARFRSAFRPRRYSCSYSEATDLVAGQIKAIKRFWKKICDTAALSEVDRNFLWRRQFLNAFAFVNAPEALVKLMEQ